MSAELPSFDGEPSLSEQGSHAAAELVQAQAARPMAGPQLGGAAAAWVGWALFALVDAVAIHIVGPESNRWPVHHAYALSYALALGFSSAGAVYVWRAVRVRALTRTTFTRALVLDFVGLWCVAMVVSFALLSGEIGAFAFRKAAELRLPMEFVRAATLWAAAVGVAFGIPVGRLLGRRVPAVGVALGLVVGAANYAVVPNDYWSVHFVIAWSSAALIGASVCSVHVPARWLGAALPVRLAVPALGALLAAAPFVMPPDPSLVVRMFRTGALPYAPLLTLRGYHAAHIEPRVPPEQTAWFHARAALPSVPATSGPPGAKSPIVLLLTIDSLRADVVGSKKEDRFVPTLAAMRDEAVYFTEARSPGSQTVYTLTTWFTGKYFSQLYWAQRLGQYWPHLDTSPRFPALLSAAGVRTIYFSAGNWLIEKHGLVGGFQKEVIVRPEGKYDNYALAREVGDRIVSALKSQGPEPLFLFSHFMDPHAPYNRGGKAKTPYRRYVREVALVDTEIARVRQAVKELGLEDRTTIIVSADHGEAFGEHGTSWHASTVYDELIHVPLLAAGPSFVQRAVGEPVTTVDLGPTILDLFGVPTPATMMGESLVPVLRGAKPHFTRPIVAENRLKQAMIFPDGIKVIRDLRYGGAEVFDLKSDPEELENRLEDPSLDTTNHFALLAAFFDAHTLKEPAGYVPPYRR